MPDAVLLCDLDGVLRTFDRSNRALEVIEGKHGLPVNTLLTTAFMPERLQSVITGRISHREWVDTTHASLTDSHGVTIADELIDCWDNDRGEVVADVLHAIRELRAARWGVILATNATSRLEEDLAYLGLDRHVDGVVNSSAFGVAKPERDFYQHAQTVAGVPVERILFVDDKAENVAGAVAFGMTGIVFENVDHLRVVSRAFT